MDGNWKLLVDGEYGGRRCKLLKYEDDEATWFKVETVQHETAISPSYRDEDDSFVGPLITNVGDAIEFEAANSEELVKQLTDGGFSLNDAQDIARHAR